MGTVRGGNQPRRIRLLEERAAFSQRPHNNQVDFPVNQGRRKHSAIEVKLAWKELGANDDRSRFYVSRIRAVISEPPAPGQTTLGTRQFDAGLVGMHIAMR